MEEVRRHLRAHPGARARARAAGEAADRVRRDHEMFRADHELGAFLSVDMVYR
ncbi:hypothetical protein [Mangrovihabitans endophyticus]|uniref:hypothetical protein n=1 Tax=Mangrovihabitans endophyticus TaxID=1751298 RepID=UPI001E3A5880|nr:hypothetical protein [Mangrovihabitans endophyticus]